MICCYSCLQLPVFISVFVGIRQMANLPVQSMTTGGLAWFTDLTIPDPFYALPLITMATFLVTIEVGYSRNLIMDSPMELLICACHTCKLIYLHHTSKQT